MSRQTVGREVLCLWIMGLLVALPGCTEGGPPKAHSDQLEAHEQPLVTVQRLAGFSEVWSRTDTGPSVLTRMDGYVLFFGEDARALYRSDGTSEGTRLVWTFRWRPPVMTPDTYPWGDQPRLVVFGARAWWLGREGLWATDGTPEGTRLVGTLGLPEISTPPVVFNGAIYFSSGNRFYRSDGTTQGTRELAQVTMVDLLPVQAQEAGGMLYFACETPALGIELCQTNGTPEGTKVVTDIVPGAGSAWPRILGGIEGRVVFSAGTGDEEIPRRLYASDGTVAGTLRLHPFATINDTASASQSGLAVGVTHLAGAAYFPCQSGSTGQELCRTGGTPETTQILDITPGTNATAPRKPVVLGAKLYFQACNDPGIGNSTCELWSSDGSVAGSRSVPGLPLGLSDGIGMNAGLIVVDDSIYLIGSGTRGSAVFKTDGTRAGTLELGTVYYHARDTRKDLLRDSVAFEGKLLFAGGQDGDTEHGLELWVSDGSVAGTRRVFDPTPRRAKGMALGLVAMEDRLFVTAHPGGYGQSFWRVDGTPPGIRVLHTSNTSLNSWIEMAAVKGRVLLSSAGVLWITDDTPAGLHQSGLPVAGTLYPAGDRVFFAGGQLWQTDGTSEGTVLIEGAPSRASYVTLVNERLWFKAKVGNQFHEGLWTSTGPPRVTTYIKEGGNDPAWFAGLGSLTLFSSHDEEAGRELWKSDGTPEGTARLADLRPGLAGSSPERLFSWKDHVYFWAAGADGATVLWRTDGTEMGTVRVRGGMIRMPVEYGWVDDGFVAWGDTLFFAGHDAEGGRELWRTDGTDEGTVRVVDLVPGLGSSNPNSFLLVSADGPLLFAAYGPTTGRELWRMDAVDAMPTLVADVVEGTGSSQPEKLTMVGSTLYFQADDGTGAGLFKLRGLIPDTFAPRLTCPPNREVAATSNDGAVVTFDAATAYDDSGEVLTLASTHASGDTFPLGATSVTLSTSDSAGNRATCAFTVSVTPAPEPDAGSPQEPDAGTPEPDAGSQSDAGTPPTEPPPDDSGCNCQTGASSGPWMLGLLGLVLLSMRRSRVSP